jgi:hypothetical protein
MIARRGPRDVAFLPRWMALVEVQTLKHPSRYPFAQLRTAFFVAYNVNVLRANLTGERGGKFVFTAPPED